MDSVTFDEPVVDEQLFMVSPFVPPFEHHHMINSSNDVVVENKLLVAVEIANTSTTPCCDITTIDNVMKYEPDDDLAPAEPEADFEIVVVAEDVIEEDEKREEETRI